MNIRTIVAMVVAVPVVLFPAAFVWYLNIGGTIAFLKELARKRHGNLS